MTRDFDNGHFRRVYKLSPFASLFSLLLLVGFTACSVESGSRGPYPRQVYTEIRTDLNFDGKRVTVKGITECKRSRNFTSEGKVIRLAILDTLGSLYRCSPQWIGKRLSDGSVLLVGSYSVIGKWGVYPDYAPPDLSKHRERIANVPRAVIWLNSPSNPTRAEYYYSSIALNDARSRVGEITTQIVGVREDLSFDQTVSDPANEVPWVGKRGGKLTAEYAAYWPKQLWSQFPELRRSLRKFDQPVFLDQRRDVSSVSLHNLTGLLPIGIGEQAHAHQRVMPATEFPEKADRMSAKGFERSRYVQPLELSAGVLRPLNFLPKGVLLLKSDPDALPKVPNMKRTVKIDVGNKTKIQSMDELRRGKLLYDPASGRIYRFQTMSIYAGEGGFAYKPALCGGSAFSNVGCR